MTIYAIAYIVILFIFYLMKIALVHDWLLNLGGAERVLISLHKIFPEAPIYTLFFDEDFLKEYLPKARVIPSFLQKVPGIKKIYPWFKIVMPSVIESFKLDKYDYIISSSHEFSHGILTKPHVKHFCYCHSPSRLLWDRAHDYVKDFQKRKTDKFKISLIKIGQHFLRLWDWTAAQRVDLYIANSKYVAKRIKKYYDKEPKVIYPPLTKLNDENSKTESKLKPIPYFLTVCQLYPHKNVDIVIAAFKRMKNLNIVIIGQGPEYNFLKSKISGFKNIKLLGFVKDEELKYYYKNCLAYIICNEEDFGISPIEAMSFGKPVLALKKGGVLESVIEGITGEFFKKPDPLELAKTVNIVYNKIKNNYYSPLVIKKYAEKFNEERFKEQIKSLIK